MPQFPLDIFQLVPYSPYVLSKMIKKAKEHYKMCHNDCADGGKRPFKHGRGVK